MEHKVRFYNSINQITDLAEKERDLLETVTDKFAFRTNSYYQSLINWDDPFDPIRRIIMPDIFELLAWGELDASSEINYTVANGLQHKYRDTALFLVTNMCGGYCRFCFRKRLFMKENEEIERNIDEGLEYLSTHKEINNVLLTGGDPLVLSNNRLASIINRIREINHIKIIRIGTKIPAFNPMRISEDPELIQMLASYSHDDRKIYVVSHFNHPREYTPEAIKAVNTLMKNGIIVTNQTPLLRGINDDPVILSQLFNALAFSGVTPYYVFQCRPTLGNFSFSIPIEQSIDIMDFAKNGCSGLARRAKLSMSHKTGKIEILGKDQDRVYFKYHRAYNPRLEGKLFNCKRNPNAYWLDDYDEFKALTNQSREMSSMANVGSHSS